jgi:PIN domain nuclease of toxin-antitoxin system
MGSPQIVLLDTHTTVWFTDGHERLGKQSKTLISQAVQESRLYVSAVSFWEVAMLSQKQRLQLTLSVMEWRNKLLTNGFRERPLTGEIAILATQLPDFHADPADRFITATAVLAEAILVTADNLILNWSGALHRQDAQR